MTSGKHKDIINAFVYETNYHTKQSRYLRVKCRRMGVESPNEGFRPAVQIPHPLLLGLLSHSSSPDRKKGDTGMEKEKNESQASAFQKPVTLIPVTKKIVQTALFISLAIAVRSFSPMVYFLGAPGMRISFSGIFSKFPALLFGPIYGGIAGGITDVIGYLLKPEGPFIPYLTLTAILGGAITGYLWKIFKNSDPAKLQRGLWILFILIGAVGLFNYLSTRFLPNSSVSLLIKQAGKYEGFLTLGLVAVSVVGLVLMILDYAARKRFPNAAVNKYYTKILLPYGISGLVVTVLNTWILIMHIPALAKIGFVLYLIPRLVEEIFMMVVQSYVAAFLMAAYDRVVRRS